MIIDGRGSAEVRCRESHQDRCPGENESRSHGRASGTPSQSQVCESSLCPSAYPYKEKLQLKRVTIEECTVFRGLCPCPRGASWLRPAWVR
jgi:hypothetical protein